MIVIGFNERTAVSICISLLTVGFTVAQISYDFDTDPQKRAQKPSFYGYVPDKGSTRTSLFMIMVLMFSNMLAIKVLGLVILGIVNMQYVAKYIGADVGLFLFIKISRDDFFYWLPLEGMASIISSLVTRTGAKIITDFTGIVQLRHPNEMGGAQWFLSQLTSIAALFVSWKVAKGSSIFGSERLEELWQLSVVLTASAASLFFLFFLIINKDYIHTFFSFETGCQMTVRLFKTHEDDSLKADAVFTNNENQWKSIRDEVKDWVQENWERWMDEKPTWLDDNMRAIIPPYMIPSEQEMKILAAEREKVGKEALPQLMWSPGRKSKKTGRRATLFGKRLESNKVTPAAGEGNLTEKEQMALARVLGNGSTAM